MRGIGFLGCIEKDLLTEEQAHSKLMELKDRETAVADEAARIHQQLIGTVSPADRQRLAESVTAVRRRAGSKERDAIRSAENPETMTWEQKRTLVEDVFGGTTADGRRMGVYVAPIDLEPIRKRRRWRYEIRGRIEAVGILKDSPVTIYFEH